MNKQDFLAGLRMALSGLPKEEVEERILFYGEIIDDRMEEGVSEEEAVAGVGTIDKVKAQIVADIPFSKLVKENVKSKRALHTGEVVLIVLGFPVWFPLLVAAGAIVFSFYMVVWALIVSLWTIEIALWACILGGIAAAIIYITMGNILSALMIFGTTFCIAGLSIFMFFGCVAASRGIFELTKRVGAAVKTVFIRKENAK